ncbi:UPF0739 protein C1orf74 homolog [Bombina bombina]|uniref:UPF0739 protein C1orf74 homolog n=1 Tax=Bombina bombina TaxID=8345 RepID=UPI00235B09AA|nr:UPF0739 protein C1orf74 homolog [Bombina bombina]
MSLTIHCKTHGSKDTASLHGKIHSAAVRHLKQTKKRSFSLPVTLKLAADVLAVDCGLKPCFLYDYSAAGVSQIESYVKELQHLGLLQGHLHILNIEGNILIINVPMAISHLETLLHSEELPIIDVSVYLKQPVICSKNQISEIQSQLSEILHHLLQYQIKQSTITSVGDICCPDWNLCTIFGYLLGFPSTYWFDTSKSFDNCLSLMPLQHVVVHASCARIDLNKVHIYSFTVPQFVYQSLNIPLQSWKDKLHQRFNEQSNFTDLQISINTVTLAAVTL